jgi:DNA-binding beta-propeller fold protein YncE
MLRLGFLSLTFVVCLFLAGLNANSLQQRTSVPLPDDDPNKVAAPDQKPQEAPATAGAADSGAAALPGSSWKQSATASGIKMDFRGVVSLKDTVIKTGPIPVSLNDVASTEMVEGQQAILQFRITDAAGAPMRGLKMAAWMDPMQGDKLADAATCHKKIQSFLQMQLSARPEVDLNTYYVLALTREPSVMVIDPRVGFSTSKLYTIIDLPAPGADWVQARNGSRVFISMPGTGQVGALDAITFRYIGNANIGGKPVRVVLQPDGKYLWVGVDAPGGSTPSGVAVVDASTLEVAARIATGKGHHEIAFDENQNAYVTNQDEGTVSLISTQKLAKIKDLATGRGPVALAYSARSKSVYVAGQGDGKINVISAESQDITTSLAAKPGLTALILTADGRWGFVANGLEDNVLLFDTASGKFIQEYKVDRSPDQLALTTSYVYVRSRESDHVRLIPLSDLGKTSHTAEFPAGQKAPGALGDLPASPVVASLDGDSAFIANPGDRRIYFYQEGMAAPMQSIEGYGKTPAAVMIVDRSIHETEPGVYSVGLRLPKPGRYDVPLFVDSPSLSHCFEFSVMVNPLLKKKNQVAVDLHPVKTNLQVRAGESTLVQFRLTDADTDKPRGALKDVEVTVLLAEGLRQMQFDAEPVGEGLYQFTFTPPQPGVYYATVQIPSLKIRRNQLPYLMVRAVEAQASEMPPAEKSGADQTKKQ